MKKLLLILLCLPLLFNSCDQCKDCYDSSGTYGGEFCRSDYSSKQEFDDAIDDAYNSGGYCVND